MTQGRGAHFLRQIEFMTAHDRRHGLSAANVLGRGSGTMTGRTGAFLPVHFLCRAIDLAACLGFVRARAPLRQLPDHHAVHEISAGLETENSVIEIDLARLRGIECHNFGFHDCASAVPSAFFTEPGTGTSLCGRLTASRTMTQPPLAPGTAPRSMMRPRSTSTFATSTFCVVPRPTPYCPLIFL